MQNLPPPVDAAFPVFTWGIFKPSDVLVGRFCCSVGCRNCSIKGLDFSLLGEDAALDESQCLSFPPTLPLDDNSLAFFSFKYSLRMTNMSASPLVFSAAKSFAILS